MTPSVSNRLQLPQLSSHPVDVGLRTEAAILAELVRRGYQVLIPFGTNQRYDLVLDMDGEFVRAQCKTGRLRKGCVLFNTQSVRTNTTGWLTRGYRGEAELFLITAQTTSESMLCRLRRLPRVPGHCGSTRREMDRRKGFAGLPSTNCPP